MSEDRYMDWLVDRKAAISKIEDEVIRKTMTKFHDDYAENYIILKGLKKKEEEDSIGGMVLG